MQIINHRIQGAEYDEARRIGGVIDPKFLVMHYTAGYTMDSARAVFKNTVIAAHVTIDKDGSILQMVPLNRRANHAGPSKWQGVSSLNNHSIGIEHVNIGWAKMQKNGDLVDSNGRTVKNPDKWIEAPNARVGSGRIFWEPYTEAQIEKSIEVTKAILETYNIRDIVSHEEIDTRGWKTDPGPAFPMNRFTSLMRGQGGENETMDHPVAGMVGIVTANSLNIRGGPGTNFEVIGKTLRGSRVGIAEHTGDWFKIHILMPDKTPGYGYVHENYIDVR